MSIYRENPAGEATAATAPRRYRYAESRGGAGTAGGAAPRTTGMATLGLDSRERRRLWLGIGAVAIGMVFFYWHEMRQAEYVWATDEGWSHGFVVPLIALFFVWLKRDLLLKLTPRGSKVGLALLLFGIAGQIIFRASGTLQMSYLSVMVVLYGAVLWILGWDYLKVLWIAISYLVFCMPPPSTLYVKVTTPMQTIAAVLGAHMLPLLGATGFRNGTIISVLRGGHVQQLNVEEACAGMRMLVAFFALAVALAYTTSRPVWEKIVLAACALPIAILCNGLRIALTGWMGVTWGEAYTKGNIHTTLGILMLVPALFLQLGAGWALDRMFIEDDGKSVAAGGRA